MTKSTAVSVVMAVMSIFVPVVPAAAFDFQQVAPESRGMSPDLLKAARDSLAAHGTDAILIIRNDAVVYEWYASKFGPGKKHYTASLAKALVGGLSFMLALDDGLVHPDAPACIWIPQWKKDAVKQMITLRHLATHTSGIEDAEENAVPHMDLPGWKGQFWRRIPDPFTVARDSASVVAAPGTRYAYSNPGMAMLSYALTSVFRGTEYPDIRSQLREKVMRPIGIGDDDWSIGYDTVYTVDGLPLVANWGGGSFTSRAVARIGRLMLRKGEWDGVQLVNTDTVDMMTAWAGMPLPLSSADDVQEVDWSSRSEVNPIPASGLCWYTNFDGVWKQVPRDAFAGAGAGGQILVVIPSLDMIIVRNGSDLHDSAQREFFWGGVESRLLNPIMESLIEPPCPPSPVISSVEFSPADSIVRKAVGSDNWPLTWADDNAMYGAYGDGWGFEPRTDIKMSLGLARIDGSPDDFTGTNIRSMSGERVGQGRNGIKASGILMIDGVLYLLVRNAGNSRLAWSNDHGASWSWADWCFEESFGAPSFLNYGRNYADARDEYVYIFSHDADSAYLSGDGTVLVRAYKKDIRDRYAWEYFAGLDRNGTPRWSKYAGKRQPVLVNPGKCYRTSVSYNPGLRRYLMCQIVAGGDTRYEGGFAIFDAPEPWGPWTTVYYTRAWDIGPGESMNLPVKWMSSDGRECYLVFSGEDAFSVRKVTFSIRDR